MKIITREDSLFDGFVKDGIEAAPKLVALNLERIDAGLYAAVDHARFKVAKIKARTVMTTLGPVTYRRRCYRDGFAGGYIWPADMVAGLSPRAKVSAELKRRLVANAAEMAYSMAGRHSCLSGQVSKSTVCRSVRDAEVRAEIGPSFAPAAAIHLQIDEKYMGFCGSKRKRPRYTATIHAGREKAEKGHKNRLVRPTIFSAASPSKLAKKANRLLKERYGVGIDDTIYVSGDLAGYIREFPERVTVCSAVYVPDKWHVLKALSDAYPEFEGAIAPSSVAGILDAIVGIGDLTRLEGANAIEVVRLYQRDPKCFDRWLDEEYAGCSQEGMNSHYYAPRFAKLANRFKPSTVEKLCSIIEARRNGTPFEVWLKVTPPDRLEDVPFLGRPYEDRAKFVIDTSQMGPGLRKVLDGIKYGGLL